MKPLHFPQRLMHELLSKRDIFSGSWRCRPLCVSLYKCKYCAEDKQREHCCALTYEPAVPDEPHNNGCNHERPECSPPCFPSPDMAEFVVDNVLKVFVVC